ncbi:MULTISPECIES: inovirus-type Gp2 protein [unclassified Colwellia]|uniref:YagK/YfjJ domain-containing protein n=1 Tax=unclassified Colwellia TaxID=196834 RepID=UPI0015F3B0C4|nr:MULTISPECIES: inovirus-type Gp2 protein [unclassified Colwellia]MBA6377687.1 inovirus-type Gp2 protein [Colwellia sp. BRX10-7]MBA6385355.1 inovirus-type Gp2 protein [Colwellia sp. BRX10-2]MBA6400270.1 inovirus-type Gp2 protein [Colwellia sp. BRX10-5]MBA6404149.1 inovirus-type Gp2 protein [Colwellia sp. BRX10-1]
MAYITKDKAITVNGQTWWVNSKGSGLIAHSIKAMINQIDAMLSHHSKIHIIRFDLRVYEYTENNGIITAFNRRLHKWLKRKYSFKRIGFMWCREIETAKKQHYHYALIIDGHKVNFPYEVTNKVKELWRQLDGSEYFPDNCYYNVKRDDYESIQDAIWRISYLAKARGKGYKPDQVKNYGTSRIKLKKAVDYP